MKQLAIWLMLLFLVVFSKAQSVERYVIASAGGTYFNGVDFEMDYTLGEVMVATLSNTSHTLTQGFQQPFTMSWVSVEENAANPTQIFYFPNPVTDELTVMVQNAKTGTYQVLLFDILGQLIYSEDISGNFDGNAKVILSFRGLSAGNYFIRFLHDEKVIKTGKIIKIY